MLITLVSSYVIIENQCLRYTHCDYASARGSLFLVITSQLLLQRTTRGKGKARERACGEGKVGARKGTKAIAGETRTCPYHKGIRADSPWRGQSTLYWKSETSCGECHWGQVCNQLQALLKPTATQEIRYCSLAWSAKLINMVIASCEVSDDDGMLMLCPRWLRPALSQLAKFAPAAIRLATILC